MFANSSSIDNRSDQSTPREISQAKSEDVEPDFFNAKELSPIMPPTRKMTVPLKIRVDLGNAVKQNPEPINNPTNLVPRKSQEITGFYNLKPEPPIDPLAEALDKI